MRLFPHSRQPGSPLCRTEKGYILITLLLFVALLAISITALAPVISQQIKRDREEELIHRGTQYSRAIKHYVKKFGRYPTRLEDLEDTNNVRFLRKRYKDPVTGKDFKLLHMGDVQGSLGSTIAGATPVAGLAQGAQGAAGNSGNAFGNSAFGSSSTFGGNGPGGTGSPFGGNNSGFGNNTPGGNTFGGQNSGFGAAPGTNPAQPPGTDATQANPGQNPADTPGTPAANQPQTGTNQATGFGSGSQVFGGGPVVGVASTSKDKTIRIYNKKNQYYQWQFIYDPTTDRGGLLTTPNQPGLQSFGAPQGTPGVNGVPGTQASPFGTQPGQMTPGGMPPAQNSPFQQQPQIPQMPPEQAPQP